MNSALTQPGPEAKNTDQGIEPELEFIKIDDGHILVRVTRGDTVTEAIISTVPSEDNQEFGNTETPSAAVSRDTP